MNIENNSIDSSILTEINKEKFKRRLSIFRSVSTRLIAIALIASIIWIGYIQLEYAKDFREVKERYGSLGYCYLCGKEALRSCGCQYYPEIGQDRINVSFLAETTALLNVEPCPPKDMYQKIDNINFSDFNLTIIP